jgi:CelD/BcsL family acetyltransferase involved in cellulose biosynthesis
LAPQWLSLWWEHFGRGKELYLVTFFHGGKAVGLAPLYRAAKRRILSVHYHLLGNGLASYLDVLALPGWETAVLESLLSHFAAQPRPVTLHLADLNDRYSRSYAAASELAGASPGSAKRFHLYTCPRAELPGDWQAYLTAQRDRKSRHNLARAERQLSGVGQWSIRVAGPEEIARLWPDIHRIHKERFQGTVNRLFAGGRDAFLLSELVKPGSALTLSILELDGVPVSFYLGFAFGDTFIDFAPAFDPALAPVSLGQIHLKHLIQTKLGQGFRYFDFSKGDAPYKRWWSNSETNSYLFLFRFHAPALEEWWLDRLYETALAMRHAGYNARIKAFCGRLRSALHFEAWRSKVAIRPSNGRVVPAGLDRVPWSYRQIRTLPLAVRKAIMHAALRNGGAPEQVAVDHKSRAVWLFGPQTNRLVSY